VRLTKTRRATLILACACSAWLMLWTLGHLRAPAETLLWGELMNFGHVLLFAVLASCMLGLCLGLFGESFPRHRLYLVAMAWALVLGGAGEAVQVFGERDVDVWDFVRNAIGAGSALAVWASVDRGIGLAPAWPRWRKHLRLLAVAAVLLAFAPVVVTAEAYRRMNERAPVLFRFDSALELLFVRPRDATLELVRAPQDWSGFAGRRVGLLTFEPSRYPGLAIFEFHHDWERYGFLDWDLFLPGSDGVEVILRIDDVHSDGRYKDRFNVKVPLQPGPNRLRIPLAEVRVAPESRGMDMSAIQAVILYVVRPEAPLRLLIGDLKLVGTASPPAG
jgi:hypothetical protein